MNELRSVGLLIICVGIQDKAEYHGGEEAFCLQWFCKHLVGSLLIKDSLWDKLLLDEAKL